ncbi:uncharacterized protein G2W53_033405 [Senna tora]|uniref:Uncharacterized protein n=1 Tax=Senna tora TaxID=362788 RepID=A0A834T9I9_9FABA|nr:uncharacterized protein G2W53_033405 [Senna tora]
MSFAKDGGGKGKKPMVSNLAPKPYSNCGKTHGGKPCLFGSNVSYIAVKWGITLETVLKRSRQGKV